MADFEVPENPEYTEAIRKFEITDPAHAELFNAVVQTLINNDTFLKKVAEQHLGNKENPHNVTKFQVGLGNVNNTADIEKNVNSAKNLSVQLNNWKQGSDLPSTYTRGETIFLSENPADKFNGIPYCTIHTIKPLTNMACIQFLYPYNSHADRFYFRESLLNSDTWRPWYEVVTSANISSQIVKKVSAGQGTSNADRHVWFSSNTQEMERDYNDGFMFNPYTQTLKVQNLQGNAASATKATQDGSGNVIKDMYSKRSIYSDGSINLGRLSTIGDRSVAYGYNVEASGNASFAVGEYVIAGGNYSHAEGYNTEASGECAHAEGTHIMADGNYSHAEGSFTRATGEASHAEGSGTEANGEDSHAEGCFTEANNFASHSSGKCSKAMITGATFSTQVGDVFVIGNGTSHNAKSNALRVTYKGDIYGTKAFQSSGADYAEYFQYKDGNPENEDRVGYFMTVENGLIKKADAGDYILGIVSGNPSIIGNADEDYYWRYERDEFNRIVMEDVPETIQKTDENGNQEFDEETHKPIMVETGNMIKNARMKLAEGYDPALQDTYVERKDRKEWACVGMLGVLPVRDDGTCIPGQFCKCKDGGIATHATEQGFDTYMVSKRISENIVSIILK